MVIKTMYQANEGKQISDSMIEGYGSLSKNINNTIELIHAVSSSSKEQQIGISQINESIASLDKQTQENSSIAQNTNNIALQTDTIFKQIVASTDEKEFLGKNDININ